MSAIFSWKPLMEILTSLSRQIASQQRELENLHAELEAERKKNEATRKDLQSQIDEKASEKSVTALRLDFSKEKVETSKRFDGIAAELSSKVKRIDARAESHAVKMAEMRGEIENKADAMIVEKLGIRVS